MCWFAQFVEKGRILPSQAAFSLDPSRHFEHLLRMINRNKNWLAQWTLVEAGCKTAPDAHTGHVGKQRGLILGTCSKIAQRDAQHKVQDHKEATAHCFATKLTTNYPNHRCRTAHHRRCHHRRQQHWEGLCLAPAPPPPLLPTPGPDCASPPCPALRPPAPPAARW